MNRFERTAGVGLRQIGFGRDMFDKLCFVHLRITLEDYLASLTRRLDP